MEINFLATRFSNSFIGSSVGILFNIGFSVIGLAGIVFALVRLYKMKRPAQIWWTLIIIFMPFGWVLYLILENTMLKNVSTDTTDQQLPQDSSQQPQAQQYSTSADQGVVTADTSLQPTFGQPENRSFQEAAPQYVDPSQKPALTGAAKAFKTIGMVLGIATMVFGALAIGFIILMVLALSSYGSNK